MNGLAGTPLLAGRRGAGAVALLVASAATGALYAASASRLGPLTTPKVALGLIAVMVALLRPGPGAAGAVVALPIDPIWAVVLSGVTLIGDVLRARPAERFGAGLLPPASAAVIAYLAVALLSIPGGIDPESAPQNTLTLGAGVLVFYTVAAVVRDRQRALWVIGGVAAALAVVGTLAVGEYATAGSGAEGFVTASGELVGRVDGGFGHPNHLGSFLVMSIPVAAAATVLLPRARLPLLLVVGIGVFAVYASFSRGALLALGAVVLVALRGRSLLVLAPVVALAAAFATPTLIEERFATLTNGGPEIESRIDIWRTAVQVAGDNALLGVGVGGFPEAYRTARVAGKRFLPNRVFQPPPHAHNAYFTALAENGLLGLLALLVVLAAGIRAAWRASRTSDRTLRVVGLALTASLVAFAVHNLFDTTFFDPKAGLLFWALLGLASAASSLAQRESGPAQRAF